MKELRFEQSRARDEAGTYTKLPFDVPEGIERIEVEYEYPRFVEETFPEGRSLREANIIDLGIYDEQGRLYGWSGSNRKKIFISSVAASPGYRRGVIRAGKWALALGLYKIESLVPITITLRLYPRERNLYRGDLHIHTLNSDGSYPTAFVMDSCQRAGLDFLALTDHNTLNQNAEIGNPEKIAVIPGVEFTNYRGHANFFFTDPGIAFHDDFLVNTFDGMAGLFRRAKAAGALISLNHPRGDYPWDFGFEDFPFDLLEVWNGPMTKHNLDSVALWQEMLREGKKIPAVGGSDMHANGLGGTFGNPCTMIYADSPCPAALLKSLAAGRCCISQDPRGPQLDLDIGGASLGETIAFRPGLRGRAVLSGAKQGDILKLITQKGAAETFTVPFNGVYTPVFPTEPRSFYRLELYRVLLEEPVLCALSNPVYVD